MQGLPNVVLLDVGNTIAFLDMSAVASAAATRNVQLDPIRLAAAEGTAKRRYAEELARGISHEASWDMYFVSLIEAAEYSRRDAEAALPALHAEQARKNLWRSMPVDLPAALSRARAQGVRFGIVSNSEGRLDALLSDLAIAEHFEVVVDSHHEGVRKPEPEIWKRALSRMRVDPRDAAYLGDIPEVDVRGAEAVGVRGVLVDPLNFYAGFDGERTESVAAWLDQRLG